MVLALRHSDALRVHEAQLIVVGVVHEQLVGALSDLPLPVVHEAAAEGHYLTSVHDGRMTATALNPVLVVSSVVDVHPLSEAIFGPGAGNHANRRYFLVGVVVLAAEEVDLRADGDEARVLSGCRQPVR